MAEFVENETVLHPKYKLPAQCFAYVGEPANPVTWKLPYLHADGTVDLARLPKAIQAILSNYRGARVTSIPENAIPDVLVRLGRAIDVVSCNPRTPTVRSSSARTQDPTALT